MLVRRKLIFRPKEECVITYDFHYETMKNLYFVLSSADPELEKFLHSTGYVTKNGKVFKLFNYSANPIGAEFDENGVHFQRNSRLEITLSGEMDIIRKMLNGLLKTKTFRYLEQIFYLEDAIEEKLPKGFPIILYGTKNPVVETKVINGEKQFLTPFCQEFYECLGQNLLDKYELVYGEGYVGPLFFEIDDALDIKNRSLKIKEQYVKGTLFNIWVEAEPKMHEIIFNLGLGQNSSTGCGTVKFVTGRR